MQLMWIFGDISQHFDIWAKLTKADSEPLLILYRKFCKYYIVIFFVVWYNWNEVKKMLRIGIADDERAAVVKLSRYVKEFMEKKGQDVKIDEYLIKILYYKDNKKKNST